MKSVFVVLIIAVVGIQTVPVALYYNVVVLRYVGLVLPTRRGLAVDMWLL